MSPRAPFFTLWILLCWFSTSLVYGQSFFDKLTQRFNEATKSLNPPERRPVSLGVTGEETEGRGVEVHSVRPNSPAELSGIRVGDVISVVNGANTRNADALASALERIRPGDTVEFEVQRGNRTLVLPVKFGDTSTNLFPPANEQLEQVPNGRPLGRDQRVDQGLSTERSLIGLSVVDLDATLAARYQIPVRQGAFVNGIQSGGPADLAGMPIAAAIVSVDGKPINSADVFIDFIRNTPPGYAVKVGYYYGDRLTHKQIRLTQLDTVNQRDDRRPGATPLEGVLGEGGRRPVLGRLGKMLDQMVEQPNAGPNRDPFAPVDPIRSAAEEQVQLLQRQVDTLQRQVDLLQRRIDELQRRSPEFRRK